MHNYCNNYLGENDNSYDINLCKARQVAKCVLSTCILPYMYTLWNLIIQLKLVLAKFVYFPSVCTSSISLVFEQVYIKPCHMERNLTRKTV